MSAKRLIVQAVEGERKVPSGRELRLSYRLGDDAPIPAILLLPDAEGPAPGALFLHGYSSRKEEMAGPISRTVRPEQAERLFAAAAEPKEIRWLDAGHRLPPHASEDVADWLRARLSADTVRDRTG
ncbi:MAG: hypothetical protein EXR95_02360 [Gemmatimonadetes bacterium]|nr:hypothetical protein [Gemmatimonadota bacterium]